MTYLVLKWIHLVSVLLFSSGMLVTPWLVNNLCDQPRSQSQQTLLANVRGYHRKITSPALLLVWALGLAMAQTAQWWSHPWFRAKLLVALLLSAQHGAVSGRLRHLCSQPDRVFPPLRFPWFALGMTVVVGLVVVKPSI